MMKCIDQLLTQCGIAYSLLTYVSMCLAQYGLLVVAF